MAMSNYPIFSVLGIEIEYMLVDKETLTIQPKSDLIIKHLAGAYVNEAILGEIAISNEFVMHVIELKNNGPKPPDEQIANQFQQTIMQLQPILDEYQLLLLPTAAHPWMDPLVETKRWPHGNKAIYEQFDKIFDCRGHGWANLQSMHVNMPFSNDAEFNQLHNSIRILLPLLPALAASSPFLSGKRTPFLDSRLDFYGKNQQKIPSITGDIIPDFMSSRAQYEAEILNPMYQDIKEYDPKSLLQHEWLNSRAAMPKFEYNAIEIRIIDSQECVTADIAIAKAIHAILKNWYDNDFKIPFEKIYPTKNLRAIFDKAIKYGLNVSIDDPKLLEQFGIIKKEAMTIRDLWTFLIEQISHNLDHKSQLALEHILKNGSLSERIINASCNDFSKDKLKFIYRQLGECLVQNQQF